MGRLIDADKAIRDMQYYYDDCAKTSEYTRFGFETAIEVVKEAPTVEAIPKDQYEARLKADMVAMLTDIQLEIEEQRISEPHNEQEKYWNMGAKSMKDICNGIFQEKINALKE